MDDLHEAMIANNASRVAGQTNASAADGRYAGMPTGEGQNRMPQESGVIPVSYTQPRNETGIVNAALAHETTITHAAMPGASYRNTSVPIPLEQDTWVANLEWERYRDGKTDQPPDSPRRWRHRGIEEILILPPERQPDWKALLQHENALVRGNALITLARSGDPRTGDALVALINDVSRSRAMRCAAIEALASLPVTTPETLIPLSDTYNDYTDANGNRKGGISELAIEVLYALAAKMPVVNEPCFLRPLESRDAKVRLAAVCVWRDNVPHQPRQVTLPDRIVQYCGDPNTAIQEAALIAVARWRHPQALTCLDLGLRNPKSSVRITAVRGLGMMPSNESIAMLMSLVNDPSKAIRAEVVTALGRVGLFDKVYQMSDDPDWEVRRVVARELAKSNNLQTQAIAQKYLHDRSTQVQQATLESMRHWHPESTAAMLFDAMDGNALETRMTATEMLARFWEPARQYQPNGRPELRKRHYQQLAVQFQHDMQKEERLQASGFRLQESVSNHNPEVHRVIDRGTGTKPEATDEPTQADFDRVRMLLAQLQQGGTQQQYQNTLTQLADTEPMLVEILEQLVIAEGRPLHDAVYHRVLPGIDPLFEISNQLENHDVDRRRAAVAELVNATKFENVSPLLYRQLAAHAVREPDEIVLLRLWDFLDRQAERFSQLDVERRGTDATDDMFKRWELFVRSQMQLRKSLATGSLAHASPELHRRVCVHIRKYGRPDDVPMLLAEIRHPVASVSRAALQALSQLGSIELAEYVRPLLNHAQPLVVVDAALALDRWGDPAGMNALERLAVSGDRTTKLALVQGIKKGARGEERGTRGERPGESISHPSPLTSHPSSLSRYVPLLIRLLDETGAIRQEALDALPLAAGHDVVPPQETAFYSPQERIELWKNSGPEYRLQTQSAK